MGGEWWKYIVLRHEEDGGMTNSGVWMGERVQL